MQCLLMVYSSRLIHRLIEMSLGMLSAVNMMEEVISDGEEEVPSKKAKKTSRQRKEEKRKRELRCS